MSTNRPDPEGEVVLEDMAEVIKAAEDRNGSWPWLGEPSFGSIPERSSLAERVSLWTMSAILGVVTIYAIATGNQEVLILVVTVAAGTLLRLTRRMPEKHKDGEKTHDPRTKRRRKTTQPE